MTDAIDKLSYFQAITGVEDVDLCTEILSAHGWDLELAISTFTSTLSSEVLLSFMNDNFAAWGGSSRGTEGFKMSNGLKASRFPFCAVVMAATNQRIALLQYVEGPKSPEEMLTLLQRVLEESSTVLVAARLEDEERLNNVRLRKEQDAAYQATLTWVVLYV